MAFPPLGNSDYLLSQFPLTFQNSKQGALFHCIAYDYSRADWDGLCNDLRDVPWGILLNSVLLLLLVNFIGIEVYIRHCKYQVRSHSFLWFSAACASAIVHRNHLFCLYQQNKSSESKVKFRQASNHCKRVLEAAKLAYVIKTKESITSQKLGS